MAEFTLRPYQQDNVDFGMKHKGLINGDEPGLGKTLTTLETVHRRNPSTILIVAPKIAVGVWAMEAKKWFGWESMIITGDYVKKTREVMRKDFDSRNMRVMIINPEQLEEILSWRESWGAIICDEIHLMGLLNPKTKTFKIMCKASTEYMYLLTGTPVRRGPQDLYGPLHLLNPLKFKSYWSFVKRYCIEIETPFGKEIAGRPKDPIAFKQMLDLYMVRHLKKNVLPDLPDKIRQPIPMTLNKEQAKAYRDLEKEMMLEVGDDVILTPGVLTRNLRLRQLLICPKILGLNTNGTALDSLVDVLIPEEFNCGRSVVVATPFRTAVPFIEEAIEAAMPGTKVFKIHGGQKDLASTIAERFQNYPGNKKVLIYTIKAGASFTAHAASTAFFLGCEWSNNDNLQAEDRIHRIGQKDVVHIKYLLYPDTLDESVLAKLDDKTCAANWILKPEEVLQRMKETQNKYRGR